MAEPTRPNILFITTDQQRADSLGCYGNGYVRTPHIDALAGRGTRFDSAYIQNPVCIPSRACMMTGRYTHQHGVTYMESVIDTTPGLPAWEKTIMERLQYAGYRTAAFGKIHMMPERGFHDMQVCGGKGGRWTHSAGLPIGLGPLGPHYAHWLEERHPGGYELIYQQRREPDYKKYKSAIVNVLPLEEYVDYWIAQNTVDYLKNPPSEPFFIQCGFCGPHGPIDPPKPYDSLYPLDEIEFPANYGVDATGQPVANSPERDALIRRWVSFYYGLVTLIDDQVGRIMDALTETGLWENTIVVYVTDHGEMLGERGRFGKGNFFEPVVHSPLIVAGPDRGRAPKQVDGLVETMDVAPTILDFAGVPIPSEMQAASLRSLLEGSAGGKPAVLCEYTTNDRSRSGKCVRTEQFKYAFWGEAAPEEFYDLHADPLERNNLIGDARYAQEATALRKLMLDMLMDSSIRHVSAVRG